MKQLNRTQIILMFAGGFTMVVCAALVMALTLYADSQLAVTVLKIVPWFFIAGAILFTIMQHAQRYEGRSLTIMRLKGIQSLSGLCFVAAGLLMAENFCRIVEPYVVNDLDSYLMYCQIVKNNWVVATLIGAILQIYTTHRLTSELEKES